MQVRAIRTFSGRMGYIHQGTVFTAPDSYVRDLMRNGMVEQFIPSNFAAQEEPTNRDPAGPTDNRNLGDAPKRKDGEPGNAQGGTSAGPDTSAPEPTSAAGLGITSQSVRPARPSGKKK